MARWLRSLLALVCLVACENRHELPPAATTLGQVPRAFGITLDGELHEPAWNTTAHVFTFTDQGNEARPYSHIRLLHDAQHLYIGLYAADQDVRSKDRFQLVMNDRRLAIDPHGQRTPALDGSKVAIDLDGTIDDPSDEDEEWVVELELPLPPGPFAISATRCDTPKDGVERCGSWTAPAPMTLAP